MKVRLRFVFDTAAAQFAGVRPASLALGGLKLVAAISLCLGSAGCINWPTSLAAERGKYESRVEKKSEADRERYVERLAKLRAKLAADGKTEEAFGVDNEIKKRPAPNDAVRWMSLRVGKWESPRHEYVFRQDLTWSMLPEGDGVTHGWWKVEGNQLIEGYSGNMAGEKPGQYTILLLNSRRLIFTNGEAVFYQKKIGR